MRSSLSRLLLPALAIAAGFACAADEETFSGSLDTPGPLALVRGTDGVFTRPVAVSADRHGGRVRLLDLTAGRYAVTTPSASFLRDAALPLGRDRLLAGVAAASPDPDTLTLYAIDTRYDALIRAPWITGRTDAGDPTRIAPRVVSLNVDDADGSGPVSLSGVVLDRGEATTETWTLRFDGGEWSVRGSRSGPERPAPATGLWVSDGGAVRLTISGEPTQGDRITLKVDTGVVERFLPAPPQSILLTQDATTLAVTAGSSLFLVDPDDLALDRPVALPPGARPGRLDHDDLGMLWVADLSLSAVHRVDPVSGAVETLELPWPVRDVAPVRTAGGRARLVLAPLDGPPSLWLYDLEDDLFIDVNASSPEVDGMNLLSPVEGLAALPEPYDLPFQRNPTNGESFGADEREATVAASLASGKVVFLRADTGCLVSDRLGPRTRRRNSGTTFGDYTPEFPADPPFTAYLSSAEDSSRHVLVNACAGVARSETWRLTYDAIRSAWFASGTVTGPLDLPIREDERYTSDGGEFSLLMRAGATASVDGWRLSFDVLDGILSGSAASLADDVPQITFDLPGEPLAYVRARGPSDDDSRDDAMVPEIVVPARSEDIVVRIDARDGLITAIWD